MFWAIYEDFIQLSSFVLWSLLEIGLKIMLMLICFCGAGSLMLDLTFKFTMLKAAARLFSVPMLLNTARAYKEDIKELFLELKNYIKEEMEALREEQKDE